MNILIVDDKEQLFWSGDSWVKSREGARNYTRDQRDIAMGLARKLEAKAYINFGTEAQRALGDVPRAAFTAPSEEPQIISSPEIARKVGSITLSQVTLENYQDVFGSRFRLTKTEKDKGLSREQALRDRIKNGELKLP